MIITIKRKLNDNLQNYASFWKNTNIIINCMRNILNISAVIC